MSLGDFFKGLSLDTWYKAFVYVGGIALLFSFFVETKGISNIQLQFISSGIFLIGLGEWKNHKENSWIKPPNAYTGPTMLITESIRQPDFLGIIFDLLGTSLLIIGLFGAAKSANISQAITPTPVIMPTHTLQPTKTYTPTPSLTVTLSLTTAPDKTSTPND